MSGGRGSKRGNGGSGKKSTPGKKGGTTPCIDLTSFGFTKKSTVTSSTNKKKRPAIAVDTSSSASAVTVVARGGGGGNNAADDTSPSSSVEIITSPTKRAKTSTSTKVGTGKENGSSKKAASSTSAAAAASIPSICSTTPAKKNNNNGKRKAVASANSNSSQCSDGSQRVALLDLTQDSSSADSMDKKQPAATSMTKKSKGGEVVSSAAAQNKSSKIIATATLSGMAGSIVNKLLAPPPPPNNPTSTNQPKQQQKQRRGKRDKHQQQQGGVKRSQNDTDGPIEIYEDNGSMNNLGGRKEKVLDNNNNDNNNKKMKSSNTPLFTVGSVITVQDRTWPGRNDPGGVAKILRVHHSSDDDNGNNTTTRYDVKYVLESRKEKNVEECYITRHSEYTSPEKAKNGRNGFATKRPSPPINHAGMMQISSEGGTISIEGDEKNVAKKSSSDVARSPPKSTMNIDNNNYSPSQEQKPRGKSIEAYFSPTKESSPKKKKISPKRDNKKNVQFPKGTKSSPSRPQYSMRANALGLVRVQDPHAITCSTAVARYKSKPFDPNITTESNDAAKRVFPGAILGRASAKTISNFVDLGISNSAAGISRHHVKVLAVKGLVEGSNNGGGGDDATSAFQLSQTSTNTSGSTTNEQQSQFITPTLTIQVDQKSSNGVQVHKTKRGHRGDKYLGQGCQETLRIGDAIVFFSSEHLHYCVVGLKYPEGLGEGRNNNGALKEDAARLLEFTPKEKTTKKKTKSGSPHTCATKESAETDKTLNIDNDIMKVVEIVDKPVVAAKMKSGTQETSSGTKTDESIMDVTMELEESHPFEKTESSVIGTKSSSTASVVVKKENTQVVKKKEPTIIETTLIQKGDNVKVLFVVNDMFGEDNKEWYFGTVVKVNAESSNTSQCNILVKYDDGTISDSMQYPAPDIEKLTSDLERFPETFVVGDVVEAQFQNGKSKGQWYRGRIANVNEDGKTCDIMYYDKDYESNVPTKEEKIRLIHRCDPTSAEWMIGKSAMLSRGGSEGNRFKTGKVSKKSNNYEVSFSDGSSESFSFEDVSKAVLANLHKDIPLSKQHIWPVSMTNSMADTIRLRRQRKEQKKRTDEYSQPAVEVKTEPTAKRSGRTRASRSVASSNAVVKQEPVDDEIMFDDIENSSLGDLDLAELYIAPEGGPGVDPLVLEKRKIAKDFPPGLPNMLWCALNSPEALTGSNLLHDMLCAHDSVPPSTMVLKLMDLIKYGPKAEGSSVHFKDPARTELASQYVYALLWASRRLVRRDSGALFGPSSWDDIETLLSQSVTQTENLISGRRLAQGLHLAARGAQLLSTMLRTELQGHDLYSTTSVALDSTTMLGMPTVRLVKIYGVRSSLKTAVQHMTTSLVRHSRWVMDSGGNELSTTKSTSDESCSLEARMCLDNLGRVVCAIAWLFCVEERVGMDDKSVAFVIKDSFLVEIEKALEDLPEMNERNKKKFVKKCKMYFLMSLTEEFAECMVVNVGDMIGCKDDLSLAGLVL